MNKKMIQAIRDTVRRWHDHWERTAGSPERGPCWPIARVIADHGYGDVWFCRTAAWETDEWWGHFVVITPDGHLIDCAGEYVTSDAVPRYCGWKHENYPMHSEYTQPQVNYWHARLHRILSSQRQDNQTSVVTC